MMKDFRNKIKEEMKGKKYSIVSNDIDGLISSYIIDDIYGVKPVGYFSPILFGLNREYLTELDKIIGLDMTIDKNNKLGFSTISNHVERFYGEEKTSTSISCNDHIDDSIYERKSLFSTTLMLWITYDLPLPEDDIGKRLLLSIDSTYKQYYNEKFRPIIIEDLQYYGRYDIIKVLENSKEEDFIELIQIYRLDEELGVYIKDMNRYEMAVDFQRFKIKTSLNMVLSYLGIRDRDYEVSFRDWCELKREYCTPNEYLRIREENSRIFSYAIPYKRNVSYSVVSKIKEGDD